MAELRELALLQLDVSPQRMPKKLRLLPAVEKWL